MGAYVWYAVPVRTHAHRGGALLGGLQFVGAPPPPARAPSPPHAIALHSAARRAACVKSARGRTRGRAGDARGPRAPACSQQSTRTVTARRSEEHTAPTGRNVSSIAQNNPPILPYYEPRSVAMRTFVSTC